MNHRPIKNDAIHLHHIEVDLKGGEQFVRKLDIPEGYGTGVVLVESQNAGSTLTVEGIANEELSKYGRVKLRVGRLATNAKSIVLRINSEVATQIHVTVAFMKAKAAQVWQKMPCIVCKEVCRLLVSALLAHLGIPYLDANAGNKVDVSECADALSGAGNQLPDWLRELFGQVDPKMIAAVRSALEFVNRVLDIPDKIYAKTCEFLGLCP